MSYVAEGVTKTGYVQRARVMESYETAPDGKKEYARISNKIGSTVELFVLADNHSAVISSLSDGTKVQLLEAYDDDKLFTKVKSGDSVGYVLTSYLNADAGLTNGQVAGIIVAVLTIMITAMFLLINKQAKKGKI